MTSKHSNRTRTNHFGTEGDFLALVARLNTGAAAAFGDFLEADAEVQAATDLGEATFNVWLDNNAERLLRRFAATV